MQAAARLLKAIPLTARHHQLQLVFLCAIALTIVAGASYSALSHSAAAAAAVARLRANAPRPGVLRAEVGSAWTSHAASDAGASGSVAALSRAQDSEDVFAHEHFFWHGAAREFGGTVVESGALDGLYFSKSFALEAALGWRALNIEAGPSKFEELARNRPRALNVHTALCEAKGTVHFIQMSDHDPVAGIVEFMSPSFRAKWTPGLDLARLDENPHIVPVTCHPMRDVLAVFGVTHVDLWVLDVEGGELSVLRTVDWRAVTIDVIVAELDGNDEAKDEGVRAFLVARGYIKFHATPGRNTWFVSSAARGLRHKDGIEVPSSLAAAFA